MMSQQGILVNEPSEYRHSLRIHTWTEERLISTVRHFLDQKPSWVRLLFLIDGLDECVGDTDVLVETIRVLESMP